jgi:tRNA A37 threonylcarbamoyladenosine dehydratase
LARAGLGRFTLVDYDPLGLGNLAGQSGGFDDDGLDKVDTLALRIGQVNALAQVMMCTTCGDTGIIDRGPSETAILGDAFEQTELVIDATADISLNSTRQPVPDRTVPWLRLRRPCC